MSQAQRMHFYVFQITTIVLMTHLNSSNKVVNHPASLFFRHGTNVMIGGHFEFSNGFWIIFIHVVLHEPP